MIIISKTFLYKIDDLRKFCIGTLKKAGLDDKNADIITESLICADLRGVTSHGIVRLPTYVKRIEKGVLDPNAEMKLEKEDGAVALLNANNGFGQVAGYKAMNKSIDISKTYGIGLVGTKNSNHFGIASFYSMLALKENMIGLVLTNSSPAIAPYGTIKPLLGTNPLSIAIPAGKEKPIVLDMSMSVVARGKVRYAALTNKKIPIGWAMDKNGNPTDDPEKGLEGSLVPIGGVKGSGLSLIVDILCGVLTDSSVTGEVKNITDMSGPAKTGHMFCAINVSSFIDVDKFRRKIDSIIRNIKLLPKSSENDNVYMPGEIEFKLTEKRKREGIPLDEDVINTLNNLAEKYKLPGLS